jgi:hypothetical protein
MLRSTHTQLTYRTAQMNSTKSQIISILAQLRLRTVQHRSRLDTAVNELTQLSSSKCAEAYESGYRSNSEHIVHHQVESAAALTRAWVVFDSEHIWGSARLRGVYSTKDAAEKRRMELITKWPYDPQQKRLVAEQSEITVREYVCGEDISGTEHL